MIPTQPQTARQRVFLPVARCIAFALLAAVSLTGAAAPAGRFHAAAKNGDLAELDRAYVAKPEDLDRPDAAGVTPLMLATQEGHVDAVRSLLRKGASATHVDHGGFTPLINAVRPPAALDRMSQSWSDTLLTTLYEASRPKTDTPRIIADGNSVAPRSDTKLHDELAAMFPKLPIELLQRKATIVELLLAAGASPRPAPKARGALHFAAAIGGEELLAPLLRAGADPNSPAHEIRETPLHTAAIAGNAAAATFLLAHGADADALSGALLPGNSGAQAGAGGNTPLMAAITMNRTEFVRVLLDGGAKVEATNLTFNRALHFAAFIPDPTIARLLLDRGARISVRDRWQCTPLGYAAGKGRLAVVELLVERGADLEIADEAGYTPLLDAIEKNHLDVVKFLAAKGASFRARTNYGKTPLRVAATSKHLEVARYLIEKRKEKANGEPDDNQPPLIEAAGSGSPRITALLLDHGADPNRPDFTGSIALHTAVVCRVSVQHQWLRDRGARTIGSTSSTFSTNIAGNDADYDEIIRLLCGRGAKPDTLDRQGESPLHLAAKYGALSAVKLLLELGAARNFATRSGKTALELAAECGHAEVVKLLGGTEDMIVRRGPTAREQLTAINQRAAGDLPANPASAPSELNAGLIAALVQNARAKFGRNDHHAAIVDYDRVLTLDPRNVDALSGRGMARAMLNQRDGALADLDQAVALAPDQSGLLVQRGAARSVFGLNAPALADFDRAIALDPTNPVAFTCRAKSRTTNGDFAGALSDLNRSLELKPDDLESLISRADLHRIQRRYDPAITDYTAALKIDPNNTVVQQRRGQVHEAKNNYRAAFADFDRVLKLDPKSFEAWVGRGNAHQYLGRHEAAVADFDQAIALDARQATPYQNRGLARRALGNYDGALVDFHTALARNPKFTVAFNQRGITHQIQGDYAAAVADYDRFIRASPNLTYPRIYRFLCQRRLGQAAAVADLSSPGSKAENWTNSLVRYLAGNLATDELLRLSGASTTKTLTNTRHCEAHYVIGMTELAAGRNARARAHFEQATAKELRSLTSFHFARAELARLPSP